MVRRDDDHHFQQPQQHHQGGIFGAPLHTQTISIPMTFHVLKHWLKTAQYDHPVLLLGDLVLYTHEPRTTPKQQYQTTITARAYPLSNGQYIFMDGTETWTTSIPSGFGSPAAQVKPGDYYSLTFTFNSTMIPTQPTTCVPHPQYVQRLSTLPTQEKENLVFAIFQQQLQKAKTFYNEHCVSAQTLLRYAQETKGDLFLAEAAYNPYYILPLTQDVANELVLVEDKLQKVPARIPFHGLNLMHRLISRNMGVINVGPCGHGALCNQMRSGCCKVELQDASGAAPTATMLSPVAMPYPEPTALKQGATLLVVSLLCSREDDTKQQQSIQTFGFQFASSPPTSTTPNLPVLCKKPTLFHVQSPTPVDALILSHKRRSAAICAGLKTLFSHRITTRHIVGPSAPEKRNEFIVLGSTGASADFIKYSAIHFPTTTFQKLWASQPAEKDFSCIALNATAPPHYVDMIDPLNDPRPTPALSGNGCIGVKNFQTEQLWKNHTVLRIPTRITQITKSSDDNTIQTFACKDQHEVLSVYSYGNNFFSSIHFQQIQLDERVDLFVSMTLDRTTQMYVDVLVAFQVVNEVEEDKLRNAGYNIPKIPPPQPRGFSFGLPTPTSPPQPTDGAQPAPHAWGFEDITVCTGTLRHYEQQHLEASSTTTPNPHRPPYPFGPHNTITAGGFSFFYCPHKAIPINFKTLWGVQCSEEEAKNKIATFGAKEAFLNSLRYPVVTPTTRDDNQNIVTTIGLFDNYQVLTAVVFVEQITLAQNGRDIQQIQVSDGTERSYLANFIQQQLPLDPKTGQPQLQVGSILQIYFYLDPHASTSSSFADVVLGWKLYSTTFDQAIWAQYGNNVEATKAYWSEVVLNKELKRCAEVTYPQLKKDLVDFQQ